MMPKMKCCSCGKMPEIKTLEEDFFVIEWFVRCRCGKSGILSPSKAWAIKNWNKVTDAPKTEGALL